MLRRDLLLRAGSGAIIAAGLALTVRLPQAQPRRRGEAWTGPTVEASEFLKLDGQPEDDGLAALLRRLQGLRGATVRFPARGGRLTLSGRQLFDPPAGVRWDFGNTMIRVAGAPGGNAMLLRFGPDSEVLGLNIELAAAAQWDRLIAISDRTLVDRLRVAADHQLANGNDSADGLVQLRGSQVELVAATLSGIDRPLIVIGAGATAQDAAALDDVRITDLRVSRFVTGVRVRNVRGCRISGLQMSERSSNANQNPGHNGLLIGHVQDFVLEKFSIQDAGEHAIRIGGSPNHFEVQSKGIRIVDGRIRQPGKCGIKFWSGGKDVELSRWFTSKVELRRIDVADCGFGGKLGVNENAVHLEAVQDFVVDGLVANPERSAASCHDVLFLSGCSRGKISNVRARAAARSVVWLTQNVANTRNLPVRDIRGSQIQSSAHRGDFIHLDIPDEECGPFVFSALDSEGGDHFVGGVAGRLDKESRFEGRARGLGGAPNGLSGNQRVKVNVLRS